MQKISFLLLCFLLVFTSQKALAADCSVNSGSDTSISADCDGFDLNSSNSNTITIDLNHSNFSSLQSQGWIQFTAEKMLILKLSSSSYKAFDGRCPHQGIHTAWSYNTSNNRFTCGQHGNSYDTDCVTPGNGGVLTCYNTTLSGSSLVVTT